MKHKRTFLVGDDWVYYKVFAKPKSIDSILCEHLPAQLELLKSKGFFEKWFFVRYDIPEFHLRLRFYSSKKGNSLKVISQLHPFFEKLFNDKLIYELELASYTREIERYGADWIEPVESLFSFDSEFMISFLSLISRMPNGEELRWLYSLRLIDQYYDCFEYPTIDRLKHIEAMRNSFWREFGVGKKTKRQIDRLYREKSGLIGDYLEVKNKLTEVEVNLEDRGNRTRYLVGEMSEQSREKNSRIDQNGLLSSFIHMTMNRLFMSKNRLHEVVCYDFLKRYYTSSLKRNNLVGSINENS